MDRRSIKPSHQTRLSERGNVFVFLLLGIVLFSALAFTVSSGFRSQTTGTMSERDAQLAASDIMSFAQSVERGISLLRRNGVSESDISFDNEEISGYNHASAQPAAHHIFDQSGAGVSWRNPPPGANDGSDWVFTGASCVQDLNKGGSGCDSDGDTGNEELLLILPNVDPAVCTALNDRLGISGTPANSGDAYTATKYRGSFTNSAEIIIAGGPYAAVCYSQSSANHFYYALMER